MITRVPAQMGQKVRRSLQDAGSNPGSGKRFYFSMTRFVQDNVPKPPFRDIEIIIRVHGTSGEATCQYQCPFPEIPGSVIGHLYSFIYSRYIGYVGSEDPFNRGLRIAMLQHLHTTSNIYRCISHSWKSLIERVH